MLNLNYDGKFDILYARFPSSKPSYGEEDENGIVTFFDIQTDEVTGMAIYGAKRRTEAGENFRGLLPISLDMNCQDIKRLFYKPELGFRCILNLT